MAGYIEDRWLTKRPDPLTGKKRKTALYGTGKRYKVTGIPGVRSKSFDHLGGPDGANAWMAKAQADSLRGEYVDPRDGKITLTKYFDTQYWPTRTGDPGTLATIERRVRVRILPHLGDMSLNAIRVPQLRAFLAVLDGKYGANSIIETWGTLSSILHAAVDDEKIPRNPCLAKSVGPPSKTPVLARAWTRERVSAVRKGLDARFQIMVDLGAGAGLRQGEVFGLAVEDIDEAAGMIHVRRQVRIIKSRQVYSLPKGGKVRTVPLPPTLAKRIREHREAFPSISVTLPWLDPDPPENEKQAEERKPQTHTLLVCGELGKGALRRTVFNEGPWKRALVAAGVILPPPEREKGDRSNTKYPAAPADGFHALRHTFASVHLHERESVVSVAKWLGHADPSITLKIYAHMMPEADGRGRKAMDAWLGSLS